MKNIILSLLSGFLFAGVCQSQNIFQVSGSANLFIPSGQIVSFDSLVLIPSTDFNIAGSNSLTKSTALFHPSVTPSIQRTYLFSNTLPSFSGSITMYYLSEELNGIPENLLELNIHDNSQWRSYGGDIVRDAVNKYVTTNGLTNVSLNELSLASVLAPLPLRGLNFKARQRNGLNYLEWTNSNEINCEKYQVQKSFNGTNWANTGNPVIAKNLPGINSYSQTDVSEEPITFYRIQKTDRNHAVFYSDIEIIRTNPSARIQIYPNPVSDYLNITTGNGSSIIKNIKVWNVQGSLIATINSSSNKYSVPLNQLPAGTYRVSVTLSDGTVSTHSFIKQ